MTDNNLYTVYLYSTIHRVKWLTVNLCTRYDLVL